MSDNLILKTLAGSRAYGLEVEGSDWDFHGVYVTPTSELLSLGSRQKMSTWTEGDEDFQSWEVGHFLHLATKCNPTVLETFVAPEVGIDKDAAHDPVRYYWLKSAGAEVRDLLPYVLSRKRVRDAFLGYAHNQRAKLFNKPDDPTAAQPTDRAWKFAAQYLRVLLQGARLLGGEFVLDMGRYGVAGTTRTFLLDVKNGRHSMGRVIDQAADLEATLNEAYKASCMQTEPDLDRVNETLLRIRRENWE